jgi:hypothetical protein
MKKATEVRSLGPQKGVKPNCDGVPGEIVDLAEVGPAAIWGRKNTKVSPYDLPLAQLAEAGPGKVLKFGDPRAWSSVGVRAKKLGFRVSRAVVDGKLFVRFDGRLDDDLRAARREKIIGCLRRQPGMTTHQVNIAVRDSGDTTFDAVLAELYLTQLVKTGDAIKRDGGTWALNPMRPAVAKTA